MTDVQKLLALRDHHLAEAKRCTDAIDLLKQVAKMAARADRITGTVAARAASTPRAARGTSTAPKAVEARKHRAAAKAGTRPMDRVRAFMAQAGDKPVPVIDLVEPIFGTDTGDHRRVLGLIISRMKGRRELREKDGAVTAWRLQPASANGATGAHP